ncbi:MAG: type II toxin-antitoxin system RelE/ParE family toxin [Candidatus Saccharibacteria bacterium]
MALFKIEINKKVRKKDLVSIPRKDILKILKKISLLASNPYPLDAIQLKGRTEWRIRQGDYRILYTVDESIVTVLVVKIGHRKEIYRK